MPPRDPRNWMWAEACELLDRAERIHRQFYRLGTPGATRPAWQPPVDVYETESEYIILIALPGVPPEAVNVGIHDGGVLIVSGERQLPVEVRSSGIYRLEIPHGYFERRIELPVGRFRLERQQCTDGCLTLALRKLP